MSKDKRVLLRRPGAGARRERWGYFRAEDVETQGLFGWEKPTAAEAKAAGHTMTVNDEPKATTEKGA